MIKLGTPEEPCWLDLPHDVRVKVRPLTTPIYEAAMAKGRRMIGDLMGGLEGVEAAGGRVEGLPDLSDPDAAAGVSQLVFVQALARLAILEWEGVGDEAGSPLPVSPVAVDRLMARYPFGERFIVLYTERYSRVLDEGNGCGPAPNGTSAAAPDTAGDAGKTTRRAPAARAGSTAGGAPTSKTRRGRRRADKPGR